MTDQNDVDLDSIIDRLLEVRGSRPGKQVQLLETEIRYLCTKAREIFISQPILLELEAPIKVCRRHYGELPLTDKWADLRRHPWTVLRPLASFRVRRFSTRGKLPLPRRLRGPRQAVA